jgi:hypothetical protein
MTYPWNAGDILTAADLNAEFGSKLDLAGGKILQVISTTKTDTFTTTQTSPTDVTGLSVSITPTLNTSKILVLAYVTFGHLASATDQTGHLRLMRGSTSIFVGDAAGSRTQSSGATNAHALDWGHSTGIFPHTLSFLDAPATASATTYKIQIWQTGGLGAVIGSAGADTDNSRYPRTPNTITVMEVSA